MNKLPELLCPAGDDMSLAAAIDAGADAVYLGYAAYSARAGVCVRRSSLPTRTG